MSTRGSKALFAIGMVVFGAVVFLFASAYLIERDLPKWLAGAVGALAFPVLPVVWHVLGERRRRTRLTAEKKPPKSSLAPGDRYVLRAIVVAAAVLAPMFVIGRFAVVRAAWDHKLWFIPEPHVDPIETAEDMMAHLPSTADAVLVFREHDDTGATSKDKKQDKKPKLGVVAYSNGQLAMIAPAESGGDKERDKEREEANLKSLDEQRKKIPFVKIEPLGLVALGNGMNGIATDLWKPMIRLAGTGPRQAIKAELAKAPKDAVVSLAYVPVASTDGIEKITGWVLQAGTNEKLTIEAEVVTTSPVAADKVMELARAGWKKQRTELPNKCHATLDKIADAAKLERTNAIVKFSVTVQPDELVEVMFCGMQSAKSD